MRKSLYTALLAGVVIPFAAFAQDATTPPATDTPPAAEAPADATAPADSTSPADSAAPADATAPAAETDPATGEAAAPAESEPMSREDATAMPDSGAAPDAATESAPADAPATDMAASTDATMADGPFVVVPPTGAWRATDLDGKDVYDTAGESIGSITDVLVSEDGEVIAVLVGVGGFLGIGQKDVAVAMEALEFGPGKTEGLPKQADVAAAQATAPVDPATGGAATGVDPAAGGAAPPAAEPPTPVVGEDNLPDRIVLNVSREQLEAAPAYGEPEEAEAAEEAAPDAGMTPVEGEPPAPQ